MNDITSCEIENPHTVEPAIVVPNPIGYGGVNYELESNRKNNEERQSNAANQWANEDGRCDCCEHGLEEEEGCHWNGTCISINTNIGWNISQTAEEAVSNKSICTRDVSKGEGKAYKGPCETSHAEHQHAIGDGAE